MRQDKTKWKWYLLDPLSVAGIVAIVLMALAVFLVFVAKH